MLNGAQDIIEQNQSLAPFTKGLITFIKNYEFFKLLYSAECNVLFLVKRLLLI